jgi:hypothetical protein
MLLVVGCLMAPAALAGAYFHSDIMDVDGYVHTVTPLADDPAIQKAVADVIAKQVSEALGADQVQPDGLPEELGDLSGEMSVQLGDLTRELTLEAVKSSAFRELWVAANRRVHPLLIKAIKSRGELNVTTGDLVGLDLAQLTADVTDELAASGVDLPSEMATGDVMLLDSRPLASAGAVILPLDRLYPTLPFATLALLILSVLVARRRLLAAFFVGAGLTLAMVALEASIAVGRARYLDATDEAGIPHAASAAIWEALTGSLRLWGWAVLVVGLAVAVAAALILLIVGRSGDGRPRQSGPTYLDYLYPPGQTQYPGGPGVPGSPPPSGGQSYADPAIPTPPRR